MFPCRAQWIRMALHEYPDRRLAIMSGGRNVVMAIAGLVTMWLVL